MELMTPHGGTLFWTALTFVVLLFVLAKFAWKPILEGLTEREQKIKESLEAADKAREDMEKAMSEQSTAMDEAKKEAQELIAKARKSADDAKADMLEKAKVEADSMVEKAKREIELSRDKAMEEIRDLAVELSMAATQKLIGKSLNKNEHQAIIENSLKKMGEMN